MDPLTAFAIAVSSVASLIEKVIEGQSPEQKIIIWNWFISDITQMRQFFHLDKTSHELKKEESLENGDGHC